MTLLDDNSVLKEWVSDKRTYLTFCEGLDTFL